MKKFIKTLLVIIGIILLFAFAAPIVANIFNIGNAVGTAASLCIIFAGIFLDNIIDFVKRMRKSKPKRIFFDALSLAVLCVIICFAVALGSVIVYSSSDTDGEETVIVLGCAVNGNKASVMLTMRVNAACKYLRENENAVAVLSGGKGEGENISEAECMYDLMIQMGIDKERLYIEDQSTNTGENIEYSLEVIRENNLSENIAIATSDYHLKRAVMIAENNGIENPGRISSKSDFVSTPTFYTREALGVIKEFITA